MAAVTTRSIKLNPFTSFLYWRMNWHAEHHRYAGVPCYHLKEQAREIDMQRLCTLWQAAPDGAIGVGRCGQRWRARKS